MTVYRGLSFGNKCISCGPALQGHTLKRPLPVNIKEAELALLSCVGLCYLWASWTVQRRRLQHWDPEAVSLWKPLGVGCFGPCCVPLCGSVSWIHEEQQYGVNRDALNHWRMIRNRQRGCCYLVQLLVSQRISWFLNNLHRNLSVKSVYEGMILKMEEVRWGKVRCQVQCLESSYSVGTWSGSSVWAMGGML